MAFEVAHDITGDLFALVVGRGHGADLGQQRRGPGGVEAELGATGMEIKEQDVEPVDPAGVLGDQVIAALGEQAHDRGLVLGLDSVQSPVVQGNRRDRDGVGDVGLPGAARSQQTCSCSQLGRDVNNELTDGDELLGNATSEPGGSLDSPLPLRPLGGPGEQRSRRRLVHDEPDCGMGLSVVFDRYRGQGTLVRVDTYRDHQGGLSS